MVKKGIYYKELTGQKMGEQYAKGLACQEDA